MLEPDLNDWRHYPLSGHVNPRLACHKGCCREAGAILGPSTKSNSAKALTRQGRASTLPGPSFSARTARILLPENVVLDDLIKRRSLLLLLRIFENMAVEVVLVLDVPLHEEVVECLVAVAALSVARRHRLPVQVVPRTLPRVGLLLVHSLGASRFRQVLRLVLLLHHAVRRRALLQPQMKRNDVLLLGRFVLQVVRGSRSSRLAPALLLVLLNSVAD